MIVKLYIEVAALYIAEIIIKQSFLINIHDSLIDETTLVAAYPYIYTYLQTDRLTESKKREIFSINHICLLQYFLFWLSS